MDTNLLRIISDIVPADLETFLIVVDRYPDKTARVWQQIAAQLGGRYSPDRLERLYDALCDRLGEPRSTTTLSMRFAYEVPISLAQLTSFPFMNLGYHASPEGPPLEDLELAEGDRKHGCNIALYRLWLTRAGLAGKDVVEVGSGRGAGGSFLTRYYELRSYTGIDGSRQQVALCNEAYPGVRFVHGVASALPLADASADVVLNVESSHCYSDVERFFAEVHRVLRPGGVFVLTDVLYRKSRIIPYVNLLDRHFRVLGKVDITKNVVSCLEAHGHDQFLRYVDSMRGPQPMSPALVMTAARVYLPLHDTAPFANYRALSAGEAVYVSFHCVKRA